MQESGEKENGRHKILPKKSRPPRNIFSERGEAYMYYLKLSITAQLELLALPQGRSRGSSIEKKVQAYKDCLLLRLLPEYYGAF